MRIAFGFDIFYPETNGVISSSINLATNLINMGHEVFFFVPHSKEFKENEIENGIKIIKIKALPSGIYKGIKLLPVYGWYLSPYLKKYKIDIIHDTSPWLVGMALNHAARRLHIPTIATHHTLIDNPIYMKYALKSKHIVKLAQGAIWTVVFNPFYNLIWMITAPSEETCAQLREHYPNTDIRYISNGIEIERFQKDAICPIPKEIPGNWLGDDTFLYIGRLGYEKAIDVTLKAFAICHRKNKKAKLIIVGRGPAEEDLKAIIKEEKLEDAVLMTGLIPNEQIIGSHLLKKVSAFVTASLSENQAMTVIEALCSGAPVICADVENMKCLVSPDQGWYFKGGDIQGLADVMCHVLNNPEERKNKALATSKSIENFDGKKVAKEFEKAYKDLLVMKENGFFVKKGEKKFNRYGN